MTEATNAYIYYSNGVCTDSNTITGTFNLTYDDSSLNNGFGLSIENYSGQCIYFKNGYLSLNDYTSERDSIDYGYCVTCNGVATCSSDESCDIVASISRSNLYQMSEVNANAEQKTEVSPQPFKSAQEVDAAVMEMIIGQSNGLSAAWYGVLGACIGFVSLFGLLAALEGHRLYRTRRRNTELSHALAEDV